MIELLFGLSGAVAILSGSLVFSIKKTKKVKEEKKQLEHALNAVNKAIGATSEIIREQDVINEQIKAGIAKRNYFDK